MNTENQSNKQDLYSRNLTGWNDEAKALCKKILETIQSANKILLHCHPSPDPDSLGSTLAMKMVLEKLGKSVTAISGDSKLPSAYSHLPGFDSVLEKNIGQVDLTKFDIFIAQDSSTIGFVSSLAPVVFPDNLKVIVIDHHVTNTHYGHINMVTPSIPANCAQLGLIFREWSSLLGRDLVDRDTARCLLLGMYTDTGGFRFTGVSALVFEIANYLMGVDQEVATFYTSDISQMENSNTKEAIFFSSLGLSKDAITVAKVGDYNVAVSVIQNSALLKAGITNDDDMHNHAVVGALRSVKDFDIVFAMFEKTVGTFKMSIRTKVNNIDVGAIADILGGGGHSKSAGATVTVSPVASSSENAELVRKKITDVVESYVCSTE